VKVADLMTREVRACTIHDSLNGAARIMWDHDCGCAPVVDAHGRLAGILTDRDIAMATYTQGLPLAAIPVERVMARHVITCARGDDVEKAHRLMRTHEIHRLPVVDSRGRLVGILSLSDLVGREDRVEPSQAVEIAETLSAIRRRRVPAVAVASASSNNGDEPPSPESTAPKKMATRRRKPSADRP
jgi:CBS domain-containing protein